MPDKMEKAVEFFKKGPKAEKTESAETSVAPETSAVSDASETRKPALSLLAQRIKEAKELKDQEVKDRELIDKEAPQIPSRNKPELMEQINKKTLSLLSGAINRGVEKVSSLFGKRKSLPSDSSPVSSEAENKILLQDNAGGNGKHKENVKEKPGWVSPDYCQSRTVQLDPGLVAGNRCLAYLDGLPAAEAYRVLRTQILQRTRGSGGNMIMVTSALPGEGKTLTAINLAFTFAREFQHTVLLVDGDLKKQSIHKYLACAGEKGLIDYLVDDTPFSELITYPGIEKMTLISGGPSFKESAEILGSPRMRELIAEMKGRYPERYVIFDVPPILTGADVLTLAPLMDQVIVVVRAGKTSMDDAGKALKFLPKDKILGLVLNSC